MNIDKAMLLARKKALIASRDLQLSRLTAAEGALAEINFIINEQGKKNAK